MLSAFIDDRGHWWQEDETSLSSRLGTKRQGDDLRPFVTRNMGYVHVASVGKTTRITFDARAVAPAALCSVMFFARDNHAYAFAVADGVGPTYLCPTADQLIAKLDHYTRPRGPVYQEIPVPVQRSAFADRWSAVRPLVNGAGLSNTTNCVLDALFNGHWTLSEADPGLGYRFLALGTWYEKFDSKRARTLIGKSPMNFGDPKFGGRVVSGFAALGDGDHPRVQRVTATLRWAGHVPRDYNFSRLILPLTTNSGSSCLLTAAVIH